jgi:hypothetical protein
MNQEPTYTVPALTCMELVSIRVALKHNLCRFWKWRHDTTWRETVRTHIAALRKLNRQEVA